MSQRNFDAPAARRLTQARRMFQIASIFAESQGAWMTPYNVTEKLLDRTGETWCMRTVARDMIAMDELGVIQRSEDRNANGQLRLYQWLGASDSATKVAVQAAERCTSRSTEQAEQFGTARTESYLRGLPFPWDMDQDQYKVATNAARLVALFDTSDRRVMKANLIYRLGEGWTLQIVGEVSTFERLKSLPQLADQVSAEIDIDSDRWELAEMEPEGRRPALVG